MTTAPDHQLLNIIMTDAYQAHNQGLAKHSLYKLHDRDLSNDAVQDTFMKTWAYLLRGGKIGIMRAFLYHTLNCLIIDEYRKPRAGSLDLLIERGFEPGVDEYQRLINTLDGKSAFLLMNRLPKKYLDIMGMRFFEHLSMQEISDRTGQTKNTITVQIHRGLTRLRALYNQPTATTS